MTPADEVPPQVYRVDDPDTTPPEPKESLLKQHSRLLLALLATALLATAVMAGWSMGPFTQDLGVRLTVVSITGAIALGIILFLLISSIGSRMRSRKEGVQERVEADEEPAAPPVIIEERAGDEPVSSPVYTHEAAQDAYRSIPVLPPEPADLPADDEPTSVSEPVLEPTLVASRTPSAGDVPPTPTPVEVASPSPEGVIDALKTGDPTPIDDIGDKVEHLMRTTDLSMSEIFERVGAA